MKIFVTLFIFIFSLQSWTKADDVRDFEIEGMSIGDSLLKHYSKNVLDNIEKYYYPNSKKIVGLYSQVFNKNLINYDAIQFSVTPDNYQIEANQSYIDTGNYFDSKFIIEDMPFCMSLIENFGDES